jgi:hypothetical protein
MADNTTLNPGVSGDVVRDIDRGTAKTQVVALDTGGRLGEALVSQIQGLATAPIGLTERQEDASAGDVLAQILIELRVLTALISELPVVLNQGSQFVRSEAQTLRADYFTPQI